MGSERCECGHGRIDHNTDGNCGLCACSQFDHDTLSTHVEVIIADYDALKADLVQARIDLEDCRQGNSALVEARNGMIKHAATCQADVERLKAQLDAMTADRNEWYARCAGAIMALPDTTICGTVREAADAVRTKDAARDQTIAALRTALQNIKGYCVARAPEFAIISNIMAECVAALENAKVE